MALNYSHRPIFPAHKAEVRSGFCLEEKCEGEFEKGRDGIDGCSSRDIIDLLPSDPFGMDIKTTFTAISGWLEDLDDYGGRGMKSGMNVGGGNEDYNLFAGFSVLWNSALGFHSVPGNVQAKSKLEKTTCSEQMNLSLGSSSNSERNDLSLGSSSKNDRNVVDGTDQGGSNLNSNPEASVSFFDTGSPHEALFFALGYLGVKDLLSVGMVCKSLYSTIKTDPLLWWNIHIEQPLNERITDEILVQLTSRAQGNLQYLGLVECPRITDGGIRRVLESNPRLNKLCVPGCTRLSIEGIVSILKTFNIDMGSQGIRCLRVGGIGGLSDVTPDQFEELKLLLGMDKHRKKNDHKPHFFLRGKIYVLCDDDRAIDIEACPICRHYRLVYDCPSETCQVKDKEMPSCRGCTICTKRCAQCGRCVDGFVYEETFFLDNICSGCVRHPSRP